MLIDIKKVIASIPEKNNAQVFNGLRIKNVSVSVDKSEKVRYWVTLTVDKPIRGSYVDSIVNEVPHYAKGLTTTVMCPIGTVTTVLFDALFECDDDTEVKVGDDTITVEDAAADLLNVKKALIADFEQLAADPKHRSAIGALLIKASINVISRDVFKEDGKAKSLFSLNETEREISNDSVWHDIYGLTGIRASKIVEAYKNFCKDAPAAPAAPINPMAAFLAALSGNGGNANVANKALE